MSRSAVRPGAVWLLALGFAALLAAGMAGVFALGNRTETRWSWVRTYGEPSAETTPPVILGPDGALPTLVVVTMDGPRSIASFRMADGSLRPVRLGSDLRPGWRLTDLDSGSASLATPRGTLRIPLSGDARGMVPPEDVGLPRLSDSAAQDAPAISSDGSPWLRCTQPEC